MIEHKQQLQASIIDRLIDDEPDFQDAPSRTEGITISELRKNVRRDIEALLNARIQWHTWPTQYTELATSCLSYGLPDFSSMSVSSHEGRALLCETVRNTILKFEPRFLEVEVFTDDLHLTLNALQLLDIFQQSLYLNDAQMLIHDCNTSITHRS